MGLVWHRNTWNTSCPWDALYAQLQIIKKDIVEYSRWFVPVKRWEIPKWLRTFPEPKNTEKNLQQKIFIVLRQYSKEELEWIQERIDTLDVTNFSSSIQEKILVFEKVIRILLDVKEKS